MPMYFPQTYGGGGEPTLGPNLTALEELASAGLINHISSGVYESVPISAFMKTLLDDTQSSTARSTLELGTISTQNYNNVTITGGTINGTPIGGTTKSTGKFTNLSTNTYIDFTPITAPTHTHGRTWFDSDEDCLTFQPSSSNATMNVGKELWVTSKNGTGSTILNGTPVYINGAVGASGKPTIAKADASVVDKSYILGVTTEDISNGGIGQVTVIGVVHDMDTSSYTEGQILYLSSVTPGTFTTTKPSSPNYTVPVARVINSHAINGSIVVLPSAPMLGYGTSNQIRGMNSSGTNEEYKSVTGSGNVVLNTGPTVTNTSLSGTVMLPSDLKNAINDVAAAALGVQVNEMYRNGSILMVRVS